MGDLVAAAVDDDPLDLPDAAVGGMDVLAAAHSYLRQGWAGAGRAGRVTSQGCLGGALGTTEAPHQARHPCTDPPRA